MEEGANASSPSAPQAAAVTADWFKFENETAKFKAEFPSQPAQATEPVDTAVGKVEMTTFSVTSSDRHLAVSTAEYPAALVKLSEPKKLIDGLRDGMVGSVNGELVSEKQVEFRGHQARHINIAATLEGQPFLFEARAFMVGNRLYQLVVVEPAASHDQAEIDRFIGSFALIET